MPYDYTQGLAERQRLLDEHRARGVPAALPTDTNSWAGNAWNLRDNRSKQQGYDEGLANLQSSYDSLQLEEKLRPYDRTPDNPGGPLASNNLWTFGNYANQRNNVPLTDAQRVQMFSGGFTPELYKGMEGTPNNTQQSAGSWQPSTNSYGETTQTWVPAQAQPKAPRGLINRNRAQLPGTGVAPTAPAPPTDPNQFRSMPAPNAAPPAGSSVAGQMTDLLGADSPYLQLARNEGLDMANRRGLINSSIAAGSSEAEAIRASLPIAQQDASTAAQFGLQRNQAGYTSGLSGQEFAQTGALQAQQTAAAKEAQIRQIEATSGLSRQEAIQQLNAQTQAEGSRAGLSSQEAKQQGVLAQQNADNALRNQNASQGGSNVQQASTNIGQIVAQAQNNIAAIQQNKDLDPPTKDRLIGEQNEWVRIQTELQNSLYGTAVKFTPQVPGGPAPPPGDVAGSNKNPRQAAPGPAPPAPMKPGQLSLSQVAIGKPSWDGFNWIIQVDGGDDKKYVNGQWVNRY